MLTNCTDSSCAARAGGVNLTARGAVHHEGFSFGVGARIGHDGSSRVTAKSPESGESPPTTWTHIIGVPASFETDRFKACVGVDVWDRWVGFCTR